MRRLVNFWFSVVGVSSLTLSGCAPTSTSRTEQRGDTLLVRGRSAEPPAVPLEILRVAGDMPGLELGQISALAVLPSGGVVIFDAQHAHGASLLEFDADGGFVRRIGRQGSGPGEYGALFVRLAVAGDGTVFLYDPSNVRLNRYRGGVPLSPIPFPAMLRSGSAGEVLHPLPDHSVLLSGSLQAQRATGARLFIRVDTSGAIVDSIVAHPSRMSEAEAAGYHAWEEIVPLPDGGVIHFRTDRIGFLRHAPSSAAPLSGEVSGTAPSYQPEERAELERIEAWSAAGRRTPRTVPDRKPISRGGFVDPSGIVWVRRSADAIRITPEVKYWDRRGRVFVSWGEPVILSGFEATGRYLGDWVFPVRATLAVRGRVAWAAVPDSRDVPQLIKYQLEW